MREWGIREWGGGEGVGDEGGRERPTRTCF